MNNTNCTSVEYSDFIYSVWSELKENQHVLLILAGLFIGGLFGLFMIECYNALFLTCQNRNSEKKSTSDIFEDDYKDNNGWKKNKNVK